MGMIFRIFAALKSAPGCIQLVSALIIIFNLLPGIAAAEIDPFPRANLEVGVAAPMRGNGPLGGYGLFLWNQPHFKDEDLYLLTILSPYLYGEVIRDKWPAEGHAVGISIGGGFFINDFDQVINGSYKRNESFSGHGTHAALSYYLRPHPIGGVMPVDGVLRFTSRYAFYQRSSDTDPSYLLPQDTFIHSARVGVRVGGVPPELVPEEAFEFSLWHEASYREKTGLHGLPTRGLGTEHLTQQSWGRLGGILPVWNKHSATVMMSAGISGNTDELSCYRLGSGVPFQDEFSYVLHGYYFREIFARSFFLLNTAYRFPIVPDQDRVQLQVHYDYALVSYLPGHELPRRNLNDLGADLIFKLIDKTTLNVGYGYGFDAPRHGHFGGHQLNVLFEWKL